MDKCRVCGQERTCTENTKNDVWVIDGNDLICGSCYIRVMNLLCERMEQEAYQRQLILEQGE